MWAAWQLSVLAIGLTCSDHLQPGRNVARPTAPPSRFTSSSWPVPPSNGRVSSGVSRLLRTRPAILTSCWLLVQGARMAETPDRALGRSQFTPTHVASAPCRLGEGCELPGGHPAGYRPWHATVPEVLRPARKPSPPNHR